MHSNHGGRATVYSIRSIHSGWKWRRRMRRRRRRRERWKRGGGGGRRGNREVERKGSCGKYKMDQGGGLGFEVKTTEKEI